MSININVNNAKKKVKDVYINKDGSKKKVKSIWVDKSGTPSKVYGGISADTNLFVCVGSGSKTYYSIDGVSWKPMTGAYGDIVGVTYGNDRFVCVGVNGVSYYSTDGLTWKPMTGLPTDTTYPSVTYRENTKIKTFVCISYSGQGYSSTDGLTWKIIGKGTSNDLKKTYALPTGPPTAT